MDQLQLKKVKPILEMEYPALRPEMAQADYLDSIQVLKTPMLRPEWDKARNSIILDLIQSQRELVEAESHLRNTRREAKKKYVENDKQWKQLREKEEQLRSSFIKFEQFVNENEDKQIRARKKIQDEIEMQNTRTQVIDDMLKQYNFVLEIKGKFEQKLKEYRMYEDFLNGVIHLAGTQFKGVGDVIKRYQTLVEKKEAVLIKRAKEMDELDNAKIDYLKLIDAKQLQLMAFNSKVVDLICRHDEARSRALHWESIVSEIKNQIEERGGQVDAVRICASNIYKMMCARRSIPPQKQVDKDDLEGQLLFIRNYLMNLKKSTALLKKANFKSAQIKKRPAGIPHKKFSRKASSKLPRSGETSSSAAVLSSLASVLNARKSSNK